METINFQLQLLIYTTSNFKYIQNFNFKYNINMRIGILYIKEG